MNCCNRVYRWNSEATVHLGSASKPALGTGFNAAFSDGGQFEKKRCRFVDIGFIWGKYRQNQFNADHCNVRTSNFYKAKPHEFSKP